MAPGAGPKPARTGGTWLESLTAALRQSPDELAEEIPDHALADQLNTAVEARDWFGALAERITDRLKDLSEG